MMQTVTLNAMPAPTWHRLGMNVAQVSIPSEIPVCSDACVSVPDEAVGADGALYDALGRAQSAWEAKHPAPTPAELAEKEAFLAAEADATYGGTALSSYQNARLEEEETRSLAASFVPASTVEASRLLQCVAGTPLVVVAKAGQNVNAQIVVSGVAHAFSAGAIDVVAEAGSAMSLSIVVGDRICQGKALPLFGSDPSEGFPNPLQDGHFANKLDDSDAFFSSECSGMTGTMLRVFVGENAQVSLTRVQALDEGFVDIDQMRMFADERASIHVDHTVLGASRTYTGLACDLRGDDSHIDIKTHFLGHGNQSHDFNYMVNHHGQRSECNLQANGVLSGNSSKTLRGTIDLIRGAKGACGSENETVLLVDKGVTNKTVPVILCNEDDVAGNHGATIGHIRDEQLFYLASRGLSQEAAERMFVGAVLEQAVIEAPDEVAREAVLRLGERLSPGFSELFDE